MDSVQQSTCSSFDEATRHLLFLIEDEIVFNKMVIVVSKNQGADAATVSIFERDRDIELAKLESLLSEQIAKGLEQSTVVAERDVIYRNIFLRMLKHDGELREARRNQNGGETPAFDAYRSVASDRFDREKARFTWSEEASEDAGVVKVKEVEAVVAVESEHVEDAVDVELDDLEARAEEVLNAAAAKVRAYLSNRKRKSEEGLESECLKKRITDEELEDAAEERPVGEEEHGEQLTVPNRNARHPLPRLKVPLL